MVNEVARIYSESCLQKQPFSLVELNQGIPDHSDPYVRNGEYYLVGIRFISNQGNITTEGLDFYAYRYPSSYWGPLGCIGNRRWIGLVSPSEKDLILFPTNNKQHFNYLAKGIAIRPKVRCWVYAGGLVEALTEFHESGYSFDLAKEPSNLEETRQLWLQGKQNPKAESLHLLIQGVNLSLEEVFSKIS
ncbi:MAG: hypothetical protein V1808_04150 [Candidatus Daviesbacteria bacterium]